VNIIRVTKQSVEAALIAMGRPNQKAEDAAWIYQFLAAQDKLHAGPNLTFLLSGLAMALSILGLGVYASIQFDQPAFLAAAFALVAIGCWFLAEVYRPHWNAQRSVTALYLIAIAVVPIIIRLGQYAYYDHLAAELNKADTVDDYGALLSVLGTSRNILDLWQMIGTAVVAYVLTVRSRISLLSVPALLAAGQVFFTLVGSDTDVSVYAYSTFGLAVILSYCAAGRYRILDFGFAFWGYAIGCVYFFLGLINAPIPADYWWITIAAAGAFWQIAGFWFIKSYVVQAFGGILLAIFAVHTVYGLLGLWGALGATFIAGALLHNFSQFGLIIRGVPMVFAVVLIPVRVVWDVLLKWTRRRLGAS
jgi:hypothetical protein